MTRRTVAAPPLDGVIREVRHSVVSDGSAQVDRALGEDEFARLTHESAACWGAAEKLATRAVHSNLVLSLKFLVDRSH